MGLRKLATVDAFKKLKPQGSMVAIEGEDIEDLKKVLFECMEDILEVCRDEKIDIVLGGGSCLGAIRHKGFIPWDDDIDLNITREGYEKFWPKFEERFGAKYWVLDAQRTPNYPVICPQVRRKGTTVRTRDDFHDKCGACVDLCIIENVPSNLFLRSIHGVISLTLGLLASCRRFAEKKDSYISIAEGNDSLIKTINQKSKIGNLLFFTSYGKLNAHWDSWNSRYRNNDSKYVSIPGGRKHYFGELTLRNTFFPAIYGEFNGAKVPIPAKSDAYMRTLYGDDYMTPPLKDEREAHVVLEFDLGNLGEKKNIKGSDE